MIKKSIIHGLAITPPSDLPPISPVTGSDRLKLSFAQQRLWFLAQLEGANATYNIPSGFSLKGELDGAALRRALDRIVARHEVLRATFTQIDGEPVQRIAPEERSWFHLIEHDLRQHRNAKGELDRLMKQEARAPFDLERGPLIRGRLIRQAEDEYTLLITMHHIVSDGWSMEILFKELGVLYRTYLGGHVDPLLKLDLQYADYGAWQRKWIASKALQQQVEYWKAMLTRVPAVLELPTDHARSVQQNYAGAFVGLELDAELTKGLKTLGKRHGTTLFLTLLAGWAVLLSRLAGEEDLVIGVPVANRKWSELERLIGPFVNTLALRLDLSGSPTVGEVLFQEKTRILEAQQHQDIPFEQVVEIVRPVRSPAHSPLFQVMFDWQGPADSRLELQGVKVEPLDETIAVTSKFDLTLALQAEGEHIVGGIEYATSLFERSTVERYVGYLRTLLQAMVTDDTQTIDCLALLPAAERHLVLEQWNATQREFPLGKCVQELFEEQVARTPGAVAVVHEDRQMSYGELNRRANQLAYYLRELGVQPDERVAICVERGVEMVVGLLAVLKAGGAYVPLDPAYPAERLRYMLEDSAPTVLLTQERLRHLFREAGNALPVLELDSNVPSWAERPAHNPNRTDVGLTPEHLAYIIYTSGSTGMPKGVMIRHGGMINHIYGQFYALAFHRTTAFLQSASLSFDISVWQIFAPLFVGGRTVIADYETVCDAAQLHALIKRQGITIIELVPSVLQALLNYAAALVPEQRVLPSLELAMVTGEAVPVSLVNQWFKIYPHLRLVNAYGPTEASDDVCQAILDGPLPADRPTVPIGKPLSNFTLYVLDRHLQLTPIGVPGEICVSGVGVGPGYWHNEAKTRAAFVPNPYADGSRGEVLYRTGDLGRWLPDGTLEFLGRNDFQVKVRGYRIELGEIEARLKECPGVQEAVVVVREDQPGDKRLVAYYLPVDGAESEDGKVGAEVFRRHLAERLPGYMVPAAYVQLEALPLTPNGKLDRQTLPAPEMDAYAVIGYEAPQGAVETALATIWSDVLKVDRVGRHDNFFELGGHSLLAITLIERMRQKGLHADVRTLFRTPTLSALAATVGIRGDVVEVPPNLIPCGCVAITPAMLPLVKLSATEIDRIVHSVPAGASNIQDIYPLAPLQEGILFHHLLTSEGDPYLQCNIYGFDSHSRLEGYLAAFQAVMDRHDILRTAVLWEGLPEPVQVVWRRAPLPVEEVQFDPANGDVAEQLKERFSLRRHRIDVRQAPLLRAYVTYDAAKQRWLLLLLSHHLLDDHTTTDTMLEEVQAHLLGQADQLPAPLPFRNFVAQARGEISREEHEAFFRRMLSDVDEPTAPFGLLDVQGDGSGIAEARLALEEELTRRIREQARKLGVSAAILFHVAWAQVVARTSGREDVVFGTILFGRMQGGTGADRVLGMFMNTLPVRIHVGQQSVQVSVRTVQTQLAELLRHEHASLALAQRCSAVPPPAPLFSALLNYRYSPNMSSKAAAATAPAWKGIEVLYGEERSNFPLTLSIDDTGEGFVLVAQVIRPIEATRVCEFMRTALESLITALAEAPETALGKIEVLPAAERHLVLEQWNATQREFPSNKYVQELFEDQVARTPGAVAVVHDDRQISYGELNRRANQLAYYLRELGVQPDERVAICVERGVEMVVGLLAVLKAGGAYVPLDPAYPAERLRYMLEDSAPTVLLTQERLRHLFREAGNALPVLELDSNVPSWAERPAHNPNRTDVGLTPEHLAYIIYTSGSTGMPKGVMIRHNGVINHIYGKFHELAFDATTAFLQSASLSFDISVWQIFAPLFVGGRTVIADYETVCDAAQLHALIKRQGITIIELVPSVLQALLNYAAALVPEQRVLPSLELAMVTGEAVPVSLVNQWFKIYPHLRLVNAYGPTEASDDVCQAILDGPLPADRPTVPIGKPLSNFTLYVLDRHLQLTPIGVPGEICVSGVGVGPGYWHNEAKTRAAFVPNPYADGSRGEVLYRTGDLGRWLPDGTLEFLGRNDFQVKVRGYRIELGEIEARLKECPGVQEAVVVVREDQPGDKRLVAYATLQAGYQAELSGQLQHKHVAMFHDIYNRTYYESHTSEALSDFAGWNSSYDGRAIPAHEMGAWRDETVTKILALKPENILEIGCGSGLLLLRLAPHCHEYIGTDLSNAAITNLTGKLSSTNLNKVQLLTREASDFSGLRHERFDTVVINSVIQYFPNSHYLMAVIRGALDVLSPGGRIFIGDVRNFALMGAFHASVQLYRSNAGESIKRLKERIRNAIAMDKELLVDPAFFDMVKVSHPRIKAIQILPKLGEYQNELTKYRYDVALHLDLIPANLPANPMLLDWVNNRLSTTSLRSTLSTADPEIVILTNIPNARIADDVRLSEFLKGEERSDIHTAEELCAYLQNTQTSGTDVAPHHLIAMCDQMGYSVQLSWWGTDYRGHYHAMLCRPTGVVNSRLWFPTNFVSRSNTPTGITNCTNDPLQVLLKGQAVADVQESLTNRLPRYMQPAHLVILDKLPLTVSSKIDRRALPVPAAIRSEIGYETPRTPNEEKLAAIWAEVLKVDKVGRHDNFFELGGHSLLAITLIERMRQKGLHADVRTLFRTPTLSALAATVGIRGDVVEVPPNLIPCGCVAITPAMLPLVKLSATEIDRIVHSVPAGASNIQDIYPLAPLQEGMLFHYLIGNRADPYLMADLYGFDSRSRLEGYFAAFQAVMDRHDILRTAVLWEGLPEPVQVVWRRAPLPVEEVQFDPANGDVAEQLKERFSLRRHRIDVRQAPLLRAYVTYDAAKQRWLLLLLDHSLVVGDHTTWDLMLEEVQAHLLGQADQLPAPLPFRNFVAQARGEISREEHEAFFRRMLSDVDEPTAPFGLLDVQGDGSGIAEARLALEEELTRRIREQARKLGVSAAILFHVAWAQVVARTSGREDVVFGTILFGRMQGGTGADRVLGMFMNTLPVRIHVGQQSVQVSVRTVQTQLAELLRHEHASLALAQRCSAVPPPAPLFSALLNYRYSPNMSSKAAAATAPAWKGIEVLYGEERSNFPLTLSIDDTGEGFVLVAQVIRPIEATRVCEFMRTALESLITALAEAPETALGKIEVLPAAERHLVLEQWNATQREFPSNKYVQELFEDQVARTPGAVAVVHDDRQISYGELNRRANQLAYYLRELGVQPDERVAICVERGVEMVVGLLAVLKAGGAYVPLDPAYPAERLRYMLEDSAPTVLLTQERLRHLFREAGNALPVLELDSNVPSWAERPAHNPNRTDVGLTPEHLAYIIYTSGSTGMPKGVMIRHNGVINHIYGKFHELAFDATTAFLQSASLSFDISVWQIFAPLFVGGRTVIADYETVCDAAQLHALIKRQGITIIELVPSVLQALLNYAAALVPEQRVLPSLELAMVTGEAVPVSLVNQWFKIYPHLRLVNAYGPTEASDDVCQAILDGPLPADRPTVPIGKPLSNFTLYVLDRHLQLTPIGVPGEICVSGVGVGPGYWHNEAKTRAAFVPNPYADGSRGEVLYRTGDLGRWLPDGTLEFLGRNDFQVKVRGYRIELGEIEARLKECPGVQEAVVVVREDQPGDKRLVAYYLPVDGAESEDGKVGAEVFRRHLAERLPGYMVPAAYVQLEALPLTPNGKLDRQTLPAPEMDAYAVIGYEAPQGAVETALATIWSDVLKVDRVGRHDNFFELGGHSLLAVRVVHLLKQVNINLLVEDLFSHPTIESLAIQALSPGRWSLRDKAIPLRQEGVGYPLFLTHCGAGELLYASVLTPHISADIPVYGLPSDMAADESALPTVEKMAARMAQMIRSTQPVGPYHIAGWSFGGTLAYEIATQLVTDNQKVEFVGLLDTYYASSTSAILRPPENNNCQLLADIAQEAGLNEELKSVIDALKAKAEELDFTALLQLCQDLSLLPRHLTNLTAIEIQHYLARNHAFDMANIRYHAQPIPITIHLFTAQNRDVGNHLRGWDAVLSKDLIRVIPISGTHISMFHAPNLEILGKALSGVIRGRVANRTTT